MSRTLSGSSTSTNRGSGSAQCAPSRGERGHHSESLSLPRIGTSSTPRVLKTKKRRDILATKRSRGPSERFYSLSLCRIWPAHRFGRKGGGGRDDGVA